MRISWFALYSGLLLSISAFSIDILLPSLLSIGTDLSTTISQVQLIIPVYMLGLGLANPFYGALSDQLGRRPGIFVGLGIYIVGGVICLFSQSILVMLCGRFLQGVGAASAPVLCRAMIRDKYSGVALGQHMATASMFFALGPMLAPLLGYAIYELFGWRAIYLWLILFAVAMLISTYVQHETLSANLRRRHNFASLRADTIAVFANRQSRYFIVLSCLCTSLILTFLAHAPIIYANLGVDTGRFAVLFALSAVGIVVGQCANHSLISVLGVQTASTLASVVVAITALLIWMFSLSDALNAAIFTALMFVFNTSFLIIVSNFVSLVLEPHAQRAGSASAMFGFATYVAGSIIAGMISFLADGKLVNWASCFLVLAVIISIGAMSYKQKLAG